MAPYRVAALRVQLKTLLCDESIPWQDALSTAHIKLRLAYPNLTNDTLEALLGGPSREAVVTTVRKFVLDSWCDARVLPVDDLPLPDDDVDDPSDPGSSSRSWSPAPTLTLNQPPQVVVFTPLPVAASPISLHPEFNGEGDVVIVCTQDDQRVGFRVQGSLLRMASPILANLLSSARVTTPRILSVDDNLHDLHAFLRLLRLGSSSSSSGVPPPFNPTVVQCAGAHRLALKYNGWYARAVLDFHVELRAASIVDTVGPHAHKDHVYTLLVLAHDLHSSFLWAEVCDRLQVKKWWHDILNPWKMNDEDAAALGNSVFSLISILASVSSRSGLYSDLHELCVLYSDEGDVSVAAAGRSSGGATAMCSCGS